MKSIFKKSKFKSTDKNKSKSKKPDPPAAGQQNRATSPTNKEDPKWSANTREPVITSIGMDTYESWVQQHAASQPAQSTASISSSVSTNNDAAAEDDDEWASDEEGQRAIVLFHYVPEQEDEIPLTKDEEIIVFEQDKSGWWTGESNGRYGLFPGAFVRLVENSEKSADAKSPTVQTPSTTQAATTKVLTRTTSTQSTAILTAQSSSPTPDSGIVSPQSSPSISTLASSGSCGNLSQQISGGESAPKPIAKESAERPPIPEKKPHTPTSEKHSPPDKPATEKPPVPDKPHVTPERPSTAATEKPPVPEKPHVTPDRSTDKPPLPEKPPVPEKPLREQGTSTNEVKPASISPSPTRLPAAIPAQNTEVTVELNKKIEALTGENERLRKEHDEVVRSLKAQIETQKKQLDEISLSTELEQWKSSAEVDNEKTINENRQLIDQRGKMLDEIKQLKETLEREVLEKDQLKDSNNSLLVEVDELIQERNALKKQLDENLQKLRTASSSSLTPLPSPTADMSQFLELKKMMEDANRRMQMEMLELKQQLVQPNSSGNQQVSKNLEHEMEGIKRTLDQERQERELMRKLLLENAMDKGVVLSKELLERTVVKEGRLFDPLNNVFLSAEGRKLRETELWLEDKTELRNRIAK